MLISIVTATYNRAAYLPKLFDSLCKQTNQNFEWIVIDDGSTDNSLEILNEFNKRSPKFPIKVCTQKNAGKHVALNKSHSLIEGDVVWTLDSDDIAMNTAVEDITNYWIDYEQTEKLAMINFLHVVEGRIELSARFPDDFWCGENINYRYKKRIKGDFAETIRSDLFKQTPFPEYENEKFFSEGWLWIQFSEGYNSVNVNKVVQRGTYLEDGLSSSNKEMFKIKGNARFGMQDLYAEMLRHKLPTSEIIKYSVMYNVYRNLNKKNYDLSWTAKLYVVATKPLASLLQVWKRMGI